ncbi:MAG TPA: chorismate mutase [Methanosarcinaceae archaeon]|nr:chorismate mutase [Methanosarcinaceae archaeon]
MNELENVRAELRQIDIQIISLIEKRVKLAEKVLDAKRHIDKSINDEDQNLVVLNRAVNEATERNLDIGVIKEIYGMLIRMNIDRQHELSGEGNLP